MWAVRRAAASGIVIDLSGMRSVYVDSANRTVRVEGGSTLSDMDRETHVFGLAVPCGIVPKTGIGGLTLGGGVGWLLRKYGMTIDNLLSCRVESHCRGRVLTSSPSEHEDHCKGAARRRRGTSVLLLRSEFRAHPVHTVLGGLLVYPREAAFDVIRHFRDFAAIRSRRTYRLRRAASRSRRKPNRGSDPPLLRRHCRRRTSSQTSAQLRQSRDGCDPAASVPGDAVDLSSGVSRR